MSKKMCKTATIAVIVFGIIVCIAIVFMRFNKINALQQTINKNATTIETLQSQLDGISESTTETVETIQQKLYSAATAGAKVADLQNNYRFIDISTETGIEDMQKNASEMDEYLEDTANRVPWYGQSDEETAWRFESTYSFSGDEVPVVWTCKSLSGELFAYATAVYHVDSGKFGDLEYHTTVIGSSHLLVDEPDVENAG